MALNNLGMGIVFTASDLASNVIQRVASGFLGLDDTVSRVSERIAKKVGASTAEVNAALSGVATGLTVAAAGVAGLVTAFALATPAGQFEQKLAGVGAVTRATAGQLKELEQAAIDAGIATQFSPTQAVEGLQSLATAGQTAGEATKTLIPVLDLAAGSLGQLGVQGAAEAVVGTLNSYQLAAENAAQVTDKLVRITQVSNFQARDFGVGLSKAAAAGATFNQSLDDTLITLGLLRNANIDASSAATSFREATRRLGADQRAQKAITETGVKVFDAQTGKMRSLLDIVSDFSDATKTLTQEEQLRRVQIAFGARGLLAFNAVSKAQTKVLRNGVEVTLRGADAIKELRKQMSEATGTSGKFRDALLDTFQGQKTLLSGTLDTIAVAIGKPFAQVLKPVVKGVVQTLNTLLQLFLALPDGVKRAFAGSAVIAAFSAIVVGLGYALYALYPILVLVSGAVWSAISPFLPLIGVVALAVAALYGLKVAWDKNFAGIQDVVVPILDKIKLAFNSLVSLLTKGEISGALAQELAKAKNSSVFGFVQSITQVFAVVKAIALGIYDAFARAFKRLAKVFAPVFKRLGETVSHLGSIFGSLFKIVQRVFGFEQVGESINTIQTLSDFFTRVLIEPIVAGVELITKAFEGFLLILNGALRVVDWIASAFSDFASIVGGAFNAVASLITGNFDGVFQSITSGLNGLIRLVNKLIDAAAKTAFALAPTAELGNKAAAKFAGLKLKEFTAPEVAFGLGASDKTVARLARKPSDVVRPGSQTGTTTGNAAPNAAGTTGGGIPQSTPNRGTQGLTNADVQKLIEAAVVSGRADERGRPIVVNSTLQIDGHTLSRVQQQQERDAQARRGRLATSIGGN